MLEFNRLLEITMNVEKPIEFTLNTDLYIRQYLTSYINGHCYDGVYVKDIISINGVSDMQIDLSGTQPVGKISLIVTVKAIIIPNRTLVVDMKLSRINDVLFIKNSILSGVINGRSNPILNSIESDLFLPVVVNSVSYPAGKTEIKLNDVPIFKYQKQVIKYTAPSDIAAMKLKIDDMKSQYTTAYNIIKHNDNGLVVDLVKKIFKTYTPVDGGAIHNIMDMSESDLVALICGKYVIAVPPLYNSLTSAANIAVYDIIPADHVDGVFAPDYLWDTLLYNMNTISKFSTIFTDSDIIKRHGVLWAYYAQ